MEEHFCFLLVSIGFLHCMTVHIRVGNILYLYIISIKYIRKESCFLLVRVEGIMINIQYCMILLIVVCGRGSSLRKVRKKSSLASLSNIFKPHMMYSIFQIMVHVLAAINTGAYFIKNRLKIDIFFLHYLECASSCCTFLLCLLRLFLKYINNFS